MIRSKITREALERLVALALERAQTFERTVLVMDAPNRNGRTYPAGEVAAALSRVRYPVIGCFMQDLAGASIPLDRATHAVTGMRLDGDRVVASIRVLDTPHGAVLRHLTSTVGEMDYRVSGIGDIGQDGVVSNFQFVSVGVCAPGSGA